MRKYSFWMLAIFFIFASLLTFGCSQVVQNYIKDVKV